MASPPSSAPFPATKWSLVLHSDRDSAQGREALSELCQAYWLPLYTFARRSGNAPADAEDLVQGFLAKAVSDRLFSRAEADRGKLRTFLLTAFRRYARDEYRKTLAEKRGGGEVISLDLIEAERWYSAAGEAGMESPEEAYDRQWALTLLERTCRRLAESFAAKDKSGEFDALRPYLTGSGDSTDYAEVAARIGMKPESVKVAVHRLRARFGALLREEVRDTHSDESDVDGELRYLIQLL